MKFFIAFALIATVASAAYLKPAGISAEAAEIQQIMEAIQSPSTNPATAAALEAMLLDLLGITPEPIAVGPAIIEQTPVAGPAIIDFPLPDGGNVVEASPVTIVDGPAAGPAASGAPLVQIILNINQAAAESSPVAVSPVQVVDSSPEQVIDVMPVVVPNEPINIIDVMPVVVQPVNVVDTAPVAVEPVLIGTPVLPSPAVVLPEELN